MQKRYYSGVGSRETPSGVCARFTELAAQLHELGYRLRSGHADGADWAFEQGAHGDADIYLPWRTFACNHTIIGTPHFGPEPWTEDISAKYHPSWSYLKPYAKKLHMRNVHQVLGDLEHPKYSQFVVCWTKGAKGSGGTGQAIRIAHGYNIPVFDYGDVAAEIQLKGFLEAVQNESINL